MSKERKPLPDKAEVNSYQLTGKNVRQVRDPYGRLVWVHKDVSPDDLPRKEFPYCKTTVDQICMIVTEGYTLKEISEIPGMPKLHILYRWSREYPEFKKSLEEAKRDRASFYHDQAIVTAMDTSRRSQVPISKLKIETLKWAAEKGAPAEYGNKTVHEGNPDKPIQFIIDTGVRREPISVTAEVVEAKEVLSDDKPKEEGSSD